MGAGAADATILFLSIVHRRSAGGGHRSSSGAWLRRFERRENSLR